ncbi:MAG: NPCBM/NEW2 domain-containing protein [Planctomycetota bacterium]
MPLPAHLPTLIACVGWLLVPALAGAVDAIVFNRDGAAAVGQPVLKDGNLLVGQTSVPCERVIGIGGVATKPRWLNPGVTLTNGDILRGGQITLQQGNLQFTSDVLGPCTIPTSAVAVIMCKARPAEWRAPAGFVGVILANDDTKAGQVEYINDQKIGINDGRRVAALPRERIAAIVLREQLRPTENHQVLHLANGDRINGQLKTLGAQGFELVSDRGTVRGSAEEWSSLWSEGPNQTPWTSVTTETQVPGVGFDYLPDGSPLTIGTRRVGHGLGMRGAGSSTASTNGSWKTLVGEIAVIEGSAKIQVLADNKPAWTSSLMHASPRGQLFIAPIAGAKSVRITVIPTDAAAPLVVIGWPTLVKN